jgi:hypothetical protein
MMEWWIVGLMKRAETQRTRVRQKDGGKKIEDGDEKEDEGRGIGVVPS